MSQVRPESRNEAKWVLDVFPRGWQTGGRVSPELFHLSSSDSQLNRLTHNAFKPLCLSLRPSLSITRPCLYHFPHTAVVLVTFPCAFFLCHTFSLCHKLSVHSLQRRSSLAPWRGHEVAVPPGGTLPSQPSQSCSNIQYVPNFLCPFFLIGGW